MCAKNKVKVVNIGAHSLQSFRQNCNKTRSDFVLDIWAQEHFYKSMSIQFTVPLKMLTTALSCKEEALYEHNLETVLSALHQSTFKMDRGKV